MTPDHHRSPPSHRPPSRRALLGSVAGLAVGGALPSAADSAPALADSAPTLTVMTRNLYLGVGLSRLFTARSMDDARSIAGRMLEEIESHPFPDRLDAIAAEVDAARPDVVGVQEAALVRTQRPSDSGDDLVRNASDVTVDLLDLLSSKLAARGLAYEVAAATTTTDVEVPADVDGRRVDVRLTDRTAVLVRDGVEFADARAGTFDADLLYRLSDTDVRLRRGYCSLDVTIDGRELTVATAHLESTNENRRLQQARELLDRLPTDRPVVLAGDFNSGPGGPSDAYALLTDSFDDAHASLRPDEDGFTCCQPDDLRNRRSRLSRRVDAVLYRGGLRPTAVERVGTEPADRTTAEVSGETVHVWPSDHAGVAATVEFATPTPTATPSATPDATATTTDTSTTAPGSTTTTTPGNGSTDASTTRPSPDSSMVSPSPGPSTAGPSDPGSRQGGPTNVPSPGFGVVGAVVSLVLAVLARRRAD